MAVTFFKRYTLYAISQQVLAQCTGANEIDGSFNSCSLPTSSNHILMLMDKIRGESDGVHEPLETFLEFEETYRTLLVLLTETPKRLPLWTFGWLLWRILQVKLLFCSPLHWFVFFQWSCWGDQTMQMYGNLNLSQISLIIAHWFCW